MTDLPARVKGLRAKMTPDKWSFAYLGEAIALLPEVMDAYLEAVEARVTVKPLVWTEAADSWQADVYSIRASYGQGHERFFLSRGTRIIRWDGAVDPLKAAAQADYDARIRSAIDVQPVTVAEAVDARASLLKRAYEAVHHDDDCPAIGGRGDEDCRCDAVPFLRDLEAALAKGDDHDAQ